MKKNPTTNKQILSGWTAENTVTSPNFLVWKFCGKVQKLYLSTKFPYQEIR